MTIKTISIKTIMCRNFKGGWGMGSKSFLGSSFKPWSSDYKGPRGSVTITIITITIITTRPKPAYGRQGLAVSWGQDTDEVSTFLVFLTSHFAPAVLSSDLTNLGPLTTMKIHLETLKNHRNQPKTMKNHGTTLKNHGNQLKTMKSHETTLKNH